MGPIKDINLDFNSNGFELKNDNKVIVIFEGPDYFDFSIEKWNKEIVEELKEFGFLFKDNFIHDIEVNIMHSSELICNNIITTLSFNDIFYKFKNFDIIELKRYENKNYLKIGLK